MNKTKQIDPRGLLKKWGGTGEAIRELEEQKEFVREGGKPWQEIEKKIEALTQFEAEMDEWMDANITITEAQLCFWRYVKDLKWKDVAEKIGHSFDGAKHMDERIRAKLANTWEE